MKPSIIRLFSICLLHLLILSACDTIPDGIVPVKDLDISKYAGTWYEIARMDSPFEKHLINVTGTYGQNGDGSISVQNRGFDTIKNKWDDIDGKARVADENFKSMLTVSFFGPFYSGYNIIALDKENYQYAMIAGSDRGYLWILSRTPTMDEAQYQSLVDKATKLDFDVSKLVRIPQRSN
jgi:apolipoprotein D and lipocalin family protein